MFKGMKKKMSKDKDKFINTLTFFITDDCFVKELRKRTGLKVSKEKALDVLDNYQNEVGDYGVLPWSEMAESWRNR